MKRFAIAACLLVTLSGCDAATDIASDTLSGEVRARYLEQCRTVAQSTGIAAENVNFACECSAENLEANLAAGDYQIDRAALEEILKLCVQEGASDAPAEGTNG